MLYPASCYVCSRRQPYCSVSTISFQHASTTNMCHTYRTRDHCECKTTFEVIMGCTRQPHQVPRPSSRVLFHPPLSISTLFQILHTIRSGANPVATIKGTITILQHTFNLDPAYTLSLLLARRIVAVRGISTIVLGYEAFSIAAVMDL